MINRNLGVRQGRCQGGRTDKGDLVSRPTVQFLGGASDGDLGSGGRRRQCEAAVERNPSRSAREGKRKLDRGQRVDEVGNRNVEATCGDGYSPGGGGQKR